MKQNYIDGKGVYHNELNLTLAQIYDSGVEFGCEVSAKDKAEDIINELEKIKSEIEEASYSIINIDGDFYDLGYRIVDIEDINEIIDNHISELKGETE